MSSKSAVKLVVAEDAPGSLYRWVAILTGSKNALKGVGFFLGGLLLTVNGLPDRDADPRRDGPGRPRDRRDAHARRLGKPDAKAKFRHMFSNNRAVNILAAARIFLFASRDVWFVVGLPVYLRDRARLDLLAGRHLPGDLGDRLRHRPGRRPRFDPAADASDRTPTGGPRRAWRSCWPPSRPRSRSR